MRFNVSAAEISLAWLRRNKTVAAPLVGALKANHFDDAVAALKVTLTDEDAKKLETPYMPGNDFQDIPTPALLHRSMEEATGFSATAPLI